MASHRIRRSKKTGLPPGSLVHLGEKKVERVKLTITDYDDTELVTREVEDLTEALAFRDSPRVTWINVDGLHDTKLIEELGAAYGIHPLTLEDCLNTGQRPKLDEFDDYLYVVLRMLYFKNGSLAAEGEQVSLILGRGFVLTFQERHGDVFSPVRQRILHKQGRIRKAGADYLFYSLMDSIVDSYAAVIEHAGEQVETLDNQVFERPTETTLDTIHRVKKHLLMLRRSVGPVREVTRTLERDESDLIDSTVQLYLEDVHDHVVMAIEYIDLYREMIKGLLDTHLSIHTQRTNEVMKVLTVLAAIFIPLTFVVGIYGMNFRYMPELEWRYGYPLVLLGMLALACSLLIYFRRRHWI